MKHHGLFLFFLTAAAVLIFPHRAPACEYLLTVTDSAGSGLAPAARRVIEQTLELNGCAPARSKNAEAIVIKADIADLKSRRRPNPKGLLLAGGLSSATKMSARAIISAETNGATAAGLPTSAEGMSAEHDYFSGFRKSRGIKKRAVENAAENFAVSFLAGIKGEGAVITRPPARNGDYLNEDSDLWPILGASLSSIAIHEAGHLVSARLTGHDTRIRGNDSRTFKAGPEMTLAFSALFALHMNEDQLLPLLPDIFMDFSRVETPTGDVYTDDYGNPVSHGRRDHALIAYSGIMFQNMSNEYILTKHPSLIDEDNPWLKGKFFFNVFLPSFYTVWGYNDDNSDLRLLQRDLGYDRWAMNALVLAPSAMDVYRYYHPEKKKLRRYSRALKVIPVIICLSQ